jgi:hypothetical protein
MNKIGLDISLSSTAICIKNGNTVKLFNYTTTKSNNIWVKTIEKEVCFRFLNKKEDVEKYSEREINKLKDFEEYSDLILDDILNNIDPHQDTIVNIEGYSFNNKNTNSLIDIVGFSTLIRQKILIRIPKVHIEIISPNTVKLQTCINTYGYIPAPIGKKGQTLKDPMISMSPNGVKGGDFEKSDMLIAMLDANIQSPILYYVTLNKSILLGSKKIPKPFDDLIDSIHIMTLVV